MGAFQDDLSPIAFDAREKAVSTWRKAISLKFDGFEMDDSGESIRPCDVIIYRLILRSIERTIVRETAKADNGARVQGAVKLKVYRENEKVLVRVDDEAVTRPAVRKLDSYHLGEIELLAFETLGYHVDVDGLSSNEWTVRWDSESSVRIGQLESGSLDLTNQELGTTWSTRR